ncbi:MAG TPA: NADH-quinone oxidoreductase subunit NuoF [Chloroflexi bacterium]|jgi:NADH-quinone oxidoreductase subunit F|nr:NADH-quinone oxidoreductase subunit NuoF [Chloroflexota bacterium]
MADSLYRANVLVCSGTGCSASGSQSVIGALQAEVTRRGLADEVRVVETGCRGFCAMGPVMIVYPEGIFYCQVQASDVAEIVEETLVKGRVVERLTYKEPVSHQAVPYYRDIPFYGKQLRVTLRNCGLINPESIDEYIARGGYEALGKALTSMTPQGVIEEVKRAGLRGRGGAGFPTGLKWEFTQKAPGDIKYVVCNADEGDPGAFMDRSILEGDPHSVIEGMTIAGYAIGAREGYVYCRAEYPLAIQRLQLAIEQATEYGLLGENILDTGFSFHLFIKEGAGAFVCGEETALIASIEGKRGEPRPRPPFPATSGLWGKPTNNNNVKSYANVPQIIANGAEWFAAIGSERSPGTAIFALTGKVRNTGLVEVPMGITMGEIIFDIGGGVPNGKQFKAVQTGGPLGGCLPASGLNLNVDFDSLREAGAVMGSGGMIVVDEDTCMVEFSKYFLTFATAESCGKCVPCRVGGKRMLEILTRITEGQGTLEDIDRIEEIATGMEEGAICALGQLTPGPIRSALRYFRDEFVAHVVDKRCPAGACKALVRAPCVNACPAGVDVPSYVSLVAQGKYAEALELHRERNPFALSCGRVCPAFCEQRCRRGELDEPVMIRQIKRYMADHEIEKPWTPLLTEAKKGKKVAIIGSGPAGLTAALRLAQWGYDVTVHEALPVAGGMMAVGIPEYRLPKDILNIEIDNIRRAGVEIKLNSCLGRDFSVNDLLERDGYHAVVLAIGAQLSRSLHLPGEDCEGVMGGTEFLKDVALGNAPDLSGKRVVVVGGGNTAIDAARTAMRLGASEVSLVYRRTREEMPAQDIEVLEAEEEGLQLHFLVNPTRVIGNGRVTGLELVRQELGDFDASARRRPIPIEGSEFVLPVDIVIAAIGQSTDVRCAEDCGVAFNRNTTVQVGRDFAATKPGVFAAGDAVLGPATVVEAVAQGNEVALAVDAYLQNGTPISKEGWLDYTDVPLTWVMEDYAEAVRAEVPVQDPTTRRLNWRQVELGLAENVCREQCMRCLRCDIEEKG